MPGTLFVVATPIGNLEDISARALRVLGEVAVIAAEDTRRTAHLLIRYAIRTPATSFNSHNEGDKADALLQRLLAGESVALVADAGTPTISDPGGHLVRLAIGAGIRVEPIPGPSAVLALLAVSGLPMDEFCFLGFPPIRSTERAEWFRRVAELKMTTVFFESPHRVLATLHQLRERFGDCQIVVGRELTKFHEQVIRGRVSDAIEAVGEPTGEFSVAINLAIQQITGPVQDLSSDHVRGLVEERRQSGRSKRQAIAEVSRLVGLTTNVIYKMLEDAKTSGD